MTRSPEDPGSEPDAFARGQADAEALREALDGVREDVAAIVREEVARVGMSRSELERMVGEAVAREARRPGVASADRDRPGWLVPALAGGGLVLGLILGAFGYRALAPGMTGAGGPTGDDAPFGATAPATPAADAAGEAVEGTRPDGTSPSGEPAPGTGRSATPAERAALYDSLLAAGSERLVPLVSRLEEAGPADPVTAAIETWRAGVALDDAQRRRLHDALVQLSLNEEAGAGLTLDGLVSRGPCRGNSCGALLQLWRERGDTLGMPELPDDPTTDSETLAVVEKVLVLGRVDASGEGGG